MIFTTIMTYLIHDTSENLRNLHCSCDTTCVRIFELLSGEDVQTANVSHVMKKLVKQPVTKKMHYKEK